MANMSKTDRPHRGVAVLALQGDFEAHAEALERAGAASRPVRTAEEVRASDALVLPGGESTTLWKLMEGTGIPEAIAEVARTRPVLGTCAGAILLARDVATWNAEAARGGSAAPDRTGLGLLDASVLRNAYGRQLDSTVLELGDTDRAALGEAPLPAVFIRAPKLTRLGPGVEVLARRDGDPVLVRSGNVLAATFHPELTRDPRVHDLFLGRAGGGRIRRVA
jgi:pyridoxal 5'-phosphate synthase pdxT subunit